MEKLMKVFRLSDEIKGYAYVKLYFDSELRLYFVQYQFGSMRQPVLREFDIRLHAEFYFENKVMFLLSY